MSIDFAPRPAFGLLFSNVVRLGFGFASNLFLAHGLGAGEFGILSLFLNIALTVSAIADFGLGISVVRLFTDYSENSENSRRFLSRVLTMRLTLSLIVSIIAFILLEFAGFGVAVDSMRAQIVVLVTFLIFFDSVANFLLAMLQAEQKFFKYALLNALPNIIRLTCFIVLFMMGNLNIVSAFLIIVFSTGSTIVVCLAAESSYRMTFHGWNWILERSFLFWSGWLFVQAIFNTLFVKLDILSLGFFHVKGEDLGNYALALTFASILTVFQTTMITFLLPKVSSVRTVVHFKAYLKRAIGLIIPIIVFSLLTLFAGREILSLFYGRRFPDSAGVFSILTIAFSISFVVTPFTLLSFCINKPQIPAIQNLAGAILLFSFCIWLIPQYGIYGVALAVLASRMIVEVAAVVVISILVRQSDLAYTT